MCVIYNISTSSVALSCSACLRDPQRLLKHMMTMSETLWYGSLGNRQPAAKRKEESVWAKIVIGAGQGSP